MVGNGEELQAAGSDSFRHSVNRSGAIGPCRMQMKIALDGGIKFFCERIEGSDEFCNCLAGPLSLVSDNRKTPAHLVLQPNGVRSSYLFSKLPLPATGLGDRCMQQGPLD